MILELKLGCYYLEVKSNGNQTWSCNRGFLNANEVKGHLELFFMRVIL